MNHFFALYKKEIQGYLYSLLSYVFIVVFLVGLSGLFWKNVFFVGQTSMRDFFNLLPWFFLFLMPALSMRLWSEEKKSGTIEKLFTYPLSDLQAVLAKFLSALTFVGVVLLFSLPIPYTLSRIGSLDWGPVIGSYIGAIMLGGAYLALGQWISGLTKNQIVAFLITIAVAFGFVAIGLPGLSGGTGIIAKAFNGLSTQTHFANMSKGVIDFRDVFYYLSFIAVFLFLNMQSLMKRKHGIQNKAQALLFLGILVTVNILLSSVSVRADLTEDKQFTLSDASKELVSDLEDPVTIKVFFSEEVPQNLLAVRQDIEDLTVEYEQAGKGNLIVEFVDPKQDPDLAAEAQTFGIPEIQFNVVGNETFEVSTGYTGISMLYRDKNEVIPVIQGTSTLEYDISGAINRMIRDEIPEVAFLELDGAVATSAIQSLLSQQYTVSALTLDELPESEIKSVVIAGHTGDLDKKQRYAIDQFIMNGGQLFVLLNGSIVDGNTLQVSSNVSGLKDLMTSYGVTVNEGLVLDYGAAETLSFGGGGFSVMKQYPFWPSIIPENMNADNPITQRLQTLALPWPSSLSIEAGEGQEIVELVKSTPQAETYDSSTATPDAIPAAQADKLSTQLLAVLVKGKITSAFVGEDKPKSADENEFVSETLEGNIFVIGSSMFIDDGILQQKPQNAIFLLNAVDVLSQDEALVSIRSRLSLNRPLDALEDSRKIAIRYGNTFSSLILVLLVSAGAYMYRRKNDKKAGYIYG